MKNQGNTINITAFFFDELPLKLFAEMDKPHPNCGKTVCFSHVMESMLPEIHQK